jgi:hypothetical protein
MHWTTIPVATMHICIYMYIFNIFTSKYTYMYVILNNTYSNLKTCIDVLCTSDDRDSDKGQAIAAVEKELGCGKPKL